MSRSVSASDEILADEAGRRRPKSGRSSDVYKSEGNKDYAAKRLYAALGKYTEALALCPANDLKKLTVCYGNRSAVFFELTEYEACLKDVERALRRCPCRDSNLRAKLHLRRYKCLKALRRDTSQEETQVSAVLESMSDENARRKLLADFEKAREEVGTGQGCKSSMIGIALPPAKDLLGGLHNRVLSFGSNKIDLRWNEDEGRHVVALEDLDPGETVFVEEPYASILLPGFHRQLCHYCHGRFLAPISCDGCVEARFCDETCREKAVFHKYECGWSKLFDSIGVGHLALRVLTTAGAHRIAAEWVASRAQETDTSVFSDVTTPLDSADYSSVWRLEHHTEKTTARDAELYKKNCALLLRYLETKTNYFQDGLERLKAEGSQMLRDELVDIVRGALLKHIHQLIVNAHAIGHVMEERSHDSDPLLFYDGVCLDQYVALNETKVATGIYPCAGMMNHSCEPNIATSFMKNVLVVRTSQRIGAGSDLFNCYGPFAKRRARESRLKELKLQYFFDCRCLACADPNDGIWVWADAFACQDCGGAVRGLRMEEICSSCSAAQDIHALEEKLEESNELWSKGMDRFDSRDPDAVGDLVKSLEIRGTVLYKFNRNLGYTYDSVARCYALTGDFLTSLFYLERSLACVAARFGDSSVEYGYELQKYLEICVAIAAQISGGKKIAIKEEFLENTAASFQKAMKIFRTLLGPWSESVQRLLVLRDSGCLPILAEKRA